MEKSNQITNLERYKRWGLDFKKITYKPVRCQSETQKLYSIILNKLYAIACYNPLTLFALISTYSQAIFKGMYFYNPMDIYSKYLLASKLFKVDDCAFANPYEEETKIFGYVFRYRACALHLFIKISKMNIEENIEELQLIDKILTNFFNSFWNLTQDAELELDKLEELIFIILFGQMKQAKLIKDNDLEYLIRNEIDISNALKYDNYEQIEINNKDEGNEKKSRDSFGIPLYIK